MRDIGLGLVSHLRAAAKGKVKIGGTEDWTSQEYDAVADLVEEDMKEGNWEGVEKLYKLIGLFPERYIGPKITRDMEDLF